MIHDVTKRRIVKQIQPKFAFMCARRFIEWVNKQDGETCGKMNIHKWHNKSVRPPPQEFRAKQLQDQIADVTKYISHVLRHKC